MEVWEEPNEIQDLAGRAFRTSESEESKCRSEVSKVLSNVRHETWYYQVIYSKFLEVGKCGKVTQGPSVKPFGSEGSVECAVTEPLDERKQAEVVCILERPRPRGSPGTRVVDCEGVVKMGDSCGVQRVAGHGTCEEGEGVVDEVGDDQFHEFLWKPGDWALWNRDDWALWDPSEWGRRRGGWLRDISLLDFGLAPPPLGDE